MFLSIKAKSLTRLFILCSVEIFVPSTLIAVIEPGWVRSKLNEFKKVRGLAFGYYSEMSKDVAELIELLAKAKKGRVMTALNLHNPAEALSWARRGIMRSLGWGLGHRPWLVETENCCFSRGGKWRE